MTTTVESNPGAKDCSVVVIGKEEEEEVAVGAGMSSPCSTAENHSFIQKQQKESKHVIDASTTNGEEFPQQLSLPTISGVRDADADADTDSGSVFLFMGTYNMNGAPLTKFDAHQWLYRNGAPNATFIILAFQECASCRDDASTPFPINVSSLITSQSNHNVKEEFCHVRQPALTRELQSNNEFMESIYSVLPKESYNLLADVSMGCTPGKDDNNVTWHGFLRLLVFHNHNDKHSLSSNDNINQRCPPPPLNIECHTLVCPTGTKHSNDNKKQNTNVTSAHNDNNKSTRSSSDKGAVCVMIPSLNLLVINVHLAGTNKYNTPESYFDQIRKQALLRISEMCESTLSDDQQQLYYSKLKPIIVGDFNFRCEVYSDAKDKACGGRDWQHVNDILMTADHDQIRRLFVDHDRLVRYLHHDDDDDDGGDGDNNNEAMDFISKQIGCSHGDNTSELSNVTNATTLPSILHNVTDLFWSECFSPRVTKTAESLLYPTFTFPINKPYPRMYAKKRTPAWTDRIVVATELLSSSSSCIQSHITAINQTNQQQQGESGGRVASIGTNHNVVTSDHVPVFCTMEFASLEALAFERRL